MTDNEEAKYLLAGVWQNLIDKYKEYIAAGDIQSAKELHEIIIQSMEPGVNVMSYNFDSTGETRYQIVEYGAQTSIEITIRGKYGGE